ncbi:MAG: FAD binding domain-containing protein [Rhodospirillales bacterium]|nr:FAD binding domain-containing protein [Rhodospirillales bacterium]MDE0385437.1 FAD binding domain-containing protein [Defluviicoccus sp.]
MELMPELTLARPDTVEEAVRLRGEDGARYLAGGTDMVVNIRRGIERPSALVDLTGIAELTAISAGPEGVDIGAAVPLAEVAAHEIVKKDYRAVAEAASEVAGPTHRNYGTVGGNLCLDTRCLYYNQSEWWRKSNAYCLKHRGEICHVAPGGKRCFAAFSGDLAPAALVHGAEVTVAGAAGRRRVALDALYRNDGMDHLALADGELVVALHLPAASAGLASGYRKARIRGSIDFPLAGVAASLRMEGGTVAALEIALTAVNPYPHRLRGCDKFLGLALDGEALDGLRDVVRSQAKPMHTTTVQPWYRRRVVGALARRLVAELAR